MKKTLKFIALLAALVIAGSLWPRSSEFDDKATLEEVLGLTLPDYRVKHYHADPILDCHGDFTDRLTLEFETPLPPSLLDSLEMKVEQDKSRKTKRWLKHDHCYRYQANYGDGRTTPKCREDSHDWFIYVEFFDNSTQATVEYGYY